MAIEIILSASITAIIYLLNRVRKLEKRIDALSITHIKAIKALAKETGHELLVTKKESLND